MDCTSTIWLMTSSVLLPLASSYLRQVLQIYWTNQTGNWVHLMSTSRKDDSAVLVCDQPVARWYVSGLGTPAVWKHNSCSSNSMTRAWCWTWWMLARVWMISVTGEGSMMASHPHVPRFLHHIYGENDDMGDRLVINHGWEYVFCSCFSAFFLLLTQTQHYAGFLTLIKGSLQAHKRHTLVGQWLDTGETHPVLPVGSTWLLSVYSSYWIIRPCKTITGCMHWKVHFFPLFGKVPYQWYSLRLHL